MCPAVRHFQRSKQEIQFVSSSWGILCVRVVYVYMYLTSKSIQTCYTLYAVGQRFHQILQTTENHIVANYVCMLSCWKLIPCTSTLKLTTRDTHIHTFSFLFIINYFALVPIYAFCSLWTFSRVPNTASISQYRFLLILCIHIVLISFPRSIRILITDDIY